MLNANPPGVFKRVAYHDCREYRGYHSYHTSLPVFTEGGGLVGVRVIWALERSISRQLQLTFVNPSTGRSWSKEESKKPRVYRFVCTIAMTQLFVLNWRVEILYGGLGTR